jgi:hypothetical protein
MGGVFTCKIGVITFEHKLTINKDREGQRVQVSVFVYSGFDGGRIILNFIKDELGLLIKDTTGTRAYSTLGFDPLVPSPGTTDENF